MKQKIIIRGALPGLNEYITAERTNRYKGAELKKRAESIVLRSLRGLGKWQEEGPVYMICHWYCEERRRDKDNISSFGRKVIQDALVRSKILPNDGWKDSSGFEDRFYVDRKNPRIVVAVSYTHLDVYKRQCNALGTNAKVSPQAFADGWMRSL